MPKLRTQMLDDYDSDDFGLKCEDRSLTKQSDAEDADINVIVRRMHLGMDPPFTGRIPMQGDFTNVTDFRGAQHLIMEAERAFNAMPAAVRARFENDPNQFLDFVSDPANGAEMVQLGLAVPRPTKAPEAPKEGQEPKEAAK